MDKWLGKVKEFGYYFLDLVFELEYEHHKDKHVQEKDSWNDNIINKT